MSDPMCVEYRRYRLEMDLTDAEVEAMARGELPDALQQQAHGMLQWQRDYVASDACAEELQREIIEWP